MAANGIGCLKCCPVAQISKPFNTPVSKFANNADLAVFFGAWLMHNDRFARAKLAIRLSNEHRRVRVMNEAPRVVRHGRNATNINGFEAQHLMI
jgi:hypothetical protein